MLLHSDRVYAVICSICVCVSYIIISTYDIWHLFYTHPLFLPVQVNASPSLTANTNDDCELKMHMLHGM